MYCSYPLIWVGASNLLASPMSRSSRALEDDGQKFSLPPSPPSSRPPSRKERKLGDWTVLKSGDVGGTRAHYEMLSQGESRIHWGRESMDIVPRLYYLRYCEVSDADSGIMRGRCTAVECEQVES